MQRFFPCLRVVYLILFAFLALSAECVAASNGEDKLELWFEYDGHQATLTEPPQVACFHQNHATSEKCDLYHSEDARYWISRPPTGEYILYVTATKDGERYYREYPFRVDDATTGPLLVALNRAIHLQQPMAEGKESSERVPGCDGYDKYSVPVLTLFSVAELNVTWPSLAEADRYHYKVWRVRCSDNMRIEPILMGSVPESALQENIPVSETGEYYSLELYARHGSQDVGQLLSGGIAATTRNAYPFVVTDPLGDRSWYPYIFLALLAPFFLWLVWWFLRGAVSLRPGKRFAWALVMVLLVVAGYLQQQTLQSWFAQGEQWLHQAGQFSQKWYRGSSGDDGYTVRAPFSGGEWSGYLVSVGSEPFYGSSRRAEIRISFSSETARVRLLQDGLWRDVTGDAFSISKSATGMSLIGHLRKGQDRELWSISIPDIHESAIRPVFDRLMTTRNLQNGRTESVRRQAIGELRHTLP